MREELPVQPASQSDTKPNQEPASQPINQETPPIIVPQPSKKSKKWLFIVIVLFSLTVSGVLGYILINKSTTKENIATPSPIIVSPQPSTQINQESLVKNNIYKNDKYLFEIPKDFTIKEEINFDNFKRIAIVNDKNIMFELSIGGRGRGAEHVVEISNESKIIDNKNVEISIFQGSGPTESCPECNAQDDYSVWIILEESSEGEGNIIWYSFNTKNVEYNEAINILDQILSTFKFIDQTDETSDWNTYRNEDIYFKYPANWTYEKLIISSSREHYGLVQLKPENYVSDILIMPFYIQYWNNPENLTIEQYDQKINQGAAMRYPLYNNGAQVTTIDNLPARYEAQGDCSPFNCYKWVVSNKNRIWEINSQYTNNANEFKSIIDQILSTFKFL